MQRPARSMPSPHALGAAQLVAWGVTFYAIPPLLPPIARELALSPTSLSIAMSAGLAVSALGSVAVGAWIQRRGARAPMVLGTVVATLALALMALGTHGLGRAAAVLVGLGVLSATSATLSYEPVFAAVGTHHRDPVARVRAIQIITFWGGWAALWAVPAATFFAETWGWRAALGILAALLFVRTLPIHRRLPSTGASAPATVSCPRPLPRRLTGGFALGACATSAVVVHGVLWLTDRAIDAGTASLVLALMAPMQIGGRIWFLRRKGRLEAYDGALPFVLVAGGLVTLLAAPHAIGLGAFVVLFGAGTGLLTTVRAALVASLVPREQIAVQLGTMSLIISLARAAGPLVGAASYAWLGFHGAVLGGAALATGGAMLVGSVRPGPPCPPERACGPEPCAA